jgi:Uma2 family endonuclease
MNTSAVSSRQFIPGSTGWTEEDLYETEIERQWEEGSYEIIEGVLATMPAAYYDGTLVMNRLRRMLERRLDEQQTAGEFATEVDLVLRRDRIVRADMIFMTPADQKKQRAANTKHGASKLKYGRVRVSPSLVLESVSPGHERHDLETKRKWYAEAGVPNYWILNAYERTLECLVLEGGGYRVDQSGSDQAEVSPKFFNGLTIALSRLWG